MRTMKNTKQAAARKPKASPQKANPAKPAARKATKPKAPATGRRTAGPTLVDPTRILARDVMHNNLLVLRADDTIRSAAEQLEEVGGGAPVVDAAGKLVGVLTSTDLSRSEHVADDGVSTRPEPREVETLEGMVDEAEEDEEVFPTEDYDSQVLGGPRVGDWMTPRVVQVEPEATVAQVARRMLDEGIHRVFVVDRERLIGLVSSEDLMRLLAAPADD